MIFIFNVVLWTRKRLTPKDVAAIKYLNNDFILIMLSLATALERCHVFNVLNLLLSN
jgi:hypothetical protein